MEPEIRTQKSSPGLTSVCFERVAFCEFSQILPGIVAGHRTPRLANLEGIVGEFWLSVQVQERWTYSMALKSTAPWFGRYSPTVLLYQEKEAYSTYSGSDP